MNDQNPFDALGLDPRTSVAELTEIMRRRAERAKNDDEREGLRAQWRRLTMRERDRLRLAFLAHPRPAIAGANPIEALREAVASTPVRRKHPEPAPSLLDCLDKPSAPLPSTPPPRWDDKDTQTDES